MGVSKRTSRGASATASTGNRRTRDGLPMPKIQLIVDLLGDPPFSTEHLCVQQWKTSPQKVIPLMEAELVARLRADRSIDLRLFRDRALRILGPDSLSSGRNVIFFDGLAYGAQIYLQSGQISGYCANSRYLMDILLGLLLFPRDADFSSSLSDWCSRSPVIGHVPLVAPCLEYPDGYPSTGDRLTPAQNRMLSEQGILIGHSLRLGKADAFSFAGVVFHLDRLCKDAGFKAARVFVDDITYRSIEAMQHLLPVTFKTEHYFECVPMIQNAELYRLMRHSHFGLCYDWFPEPFGFYPLDSVFCGTPVFTNGAGNLRHLLPQDHGIRVFDPIGLQFGTVEARFATGEAVARCILDSILSGVDQRACQAGVEFMRQNYNIDRFSRGIVGFLEACLDPQRTEPANVSQATLELSPLVRRWCATNGAVLSDYMPRQVPPEQRDLLSASLGRRIIELATALDNKSRDAILELYRNGIVTFALPCGDLCRLDPAA